MAIPEMGWPKRRREVEGNGWPKRRKEGSFSSLSYPFQIVDSGDLI